MKWWITALLLVQSALAQAAVEKILVVQEQRPLYDRDTYLSELLVLALKTAEYETSIEYVKVHPHQQRALMMLARGKADVHWSMTSPERETLAIA